MRNQKIIDISHPEEQLTAAVIWNSIEKSFTKLVQAGSNFQKWYDKSQILILGHWAAARPRPEPKPTTPETGTNIDLETAASIPIDFQAKRQQRAQLDKVEIEGSLD